MGQIQFGDGCEYRTTNHCSSKRNQERPHHQPFPGGRPTGYDPSQRWRCSRRSATRLPPLTEPLPRSVGDRGPQLGSQIGSSEDTFEVYLGGGEFPLDASPVWRYIAKDSLNAPQVAAVEQFRKAIEESEKQRHQKP